MGHRIPRDEEVLGALFQVLAEEGAVHTQRRLRDLVLTRLHRRDDAYALSGERVRVLAVRSGSVEVEVETRDDGPAPRLHRCPVCHSDLERGRNRTLGGGEVPLGYRCTWCPWWTGRTLRVPSRYSFSAAFDSPADALGSFGRA